LVPGPPVLDAQAQIRSALTNRYPARLPCPAAAWNIFIELPMSQLEQEKLVALLPYIGKLKGIAIITAEPMEVRCSPLALDLLMARSEAPARRPRLAAAGCTPARCRHAWVDQAGAGSWRHGGSGLQPVAQIEQGRAAAAPSCTQPCARAPLRARAPADSAEAAPAFLASPPRRRAWAPPTCLTRPSWTWSS
jgi:hypothetical protein